MTATDRATPALDVIQAILDLSRDPRLIETCSTEFYELTVRREKLQPETNDLNQEVGDVYIAVSRLHEDIRKIFESGKALNLKGLPRLLKRVSAVQGELAGVERLIRKKARDVRIQPPG